VILVVPTNTNTSSNDVRVEMLPMPRSRIRRMLVTGILAFRRASAANPAVYHVHDPELLFFAALLGLMGHVVIYDAHEDLGKTIGYKSYLPTWSRTVLAWATRAIEGFLANRCTAIIAATPGIKERFSGASPPVVVVQNFPRLDEFPADVPTPERRQDFVVYLGSISEARGLLEMVRAMAILKSPSVRLKLAGPFQCDPSAAQQEAGWEFVDALGTLNRSQVRQLLGTCRVGLVVLHPEKNYVNSYATKMFEYMAAGVPVVASAFPLWKRIVEESDCGILVDPKNPMEIATAIGWFLANPKEAERLGRNGREAVIRRFNWDAEQTKLLSLYQQITVSGTAGTRNSVL